MNAQIFETVFSGPFFGITLAIGITFAVIQSISNKAKSSGNTIWDYLGVGSVDDLIRWPLAIMWTALFLTLFSGIFWVLLYLAANASWDLVKGIDAERDLRWYLLTLTAMTTVLGVTVALPFTLIRTKNHNRETDATEQGLVTDRINKAVEGLGAQKEVNKLGRNILYLLGKETEVVFEWQNVPYTLPEGAHAVKYRDWTNIALTEPNIEVRIGSIYALERIARENKDYHVQVMEILCAYIRQNAPASSAVEWPEVTIGNETLDSNLKKILSDVEHKARILESAVIPRSDIQTVLNVLGRRSPVQRQWEAEAFGSNGFDSFVFDRDCPEPNNLSWSEYTARFSKWQNLISKYEGYRLDLRGTNLQGVNLVDANFSGAILIGSKLQSAKLFNTNFVGADLWKAQMQNAHFGNSNMRCANFLNANLQYSNFSSALLDGILLAGSSINCAHFGNAQLKLANIQNCEMIFTRLSYAKLNGTNLTGVDLRYSNLDGADFSNAEITPFKSYLNHLPSETNFSGASIIGAMFDNTNGIKKYMAQCVERKTS